MEIILPPRTSGRLHVVFDWNGTLIDDLMLAVQSVNHVRRRYGMADIDETIYREAFCFPIHAFYEKIGFPLETITFSEIMEAYLRQFDAQVLHCLLHNGAMHLLSMLRKAKIGCSILSASHRHTLARTLRHHEIHDYFEHVIGLSDSHAGGKLEQARSLNDALGKHNDHILLVGDTTHDIDIALGLGWTVLSVSHGHQSREILQKATTNIVDHLPGAQDFICAWAAARGGHCE
ncbi:MAG TPA: HAD hydrolase-like protein [Dongiaceae bacterium]|nr:HAD hydrolase-like protein [Dongiaceae bacterium]